MSREADLRRLREAATARQRFLDMMYARVEADEAAKQREMQAEQAGANKNWFSEGLQGAQIGASAGGPWGALVGGIIGTGVGMHKAHNQYKKEGKSTWGATWRTALGSEGFRHLDAKDMATGANAFSSAKGSYDRDQAMKSTAADEQARNRQKIQELEVLGVVSGPKARMSAGPTYRQDYKAYNPGVSGSQVQVEDPDRDMYAYNNPYEPGYRDY